jgi:transposase
MSRPIKITSEQFRALYRPGMTCRELAGIVGTSAGQASRIMRRNGVPIRRRGRPRLDEQTPAQIEARHQTVVMALRAGFPESAIARDHNVSRQAVHSLARRLEAHGVRL